jgi:hydroxyacylglutathione hydrolase
MLKSKNMEITKLELGVLRANCYIVEKDGHCLIIDPGDEPEKIISQIKELSVDGILLTHGHFDHIMGVKGLVEEIQAPLYLQEGALGEYLNAGSLSFVIGVNLNDLVKPKFTLKKGVNNIGPFEFNVIPTPGHTPGSVCFLFGGNLFSGDTLFEDSYGRTDLPGSDFNQMKESLATLASLSPEIKVYPGHGNFTTIKKESYWIKNLI